MYKKFYIIFFLFFVCPSESFSLVVGSTTDVSRESKPRFPAAHTDNKMQGFAVFEDGFCFEDETTTCTFDAAFPVSGIAGLRGGTLFLQEDLVFTNSAEITGGYISGNEKTLELPASLDEMYIPSIAFGCLIGGLSFIDEEDVGTEAVSVDWEFDGDYIAQVGEDSYLNILYFDGETLTPTTQAVIGSHGWSTRCHPSKRYIALYSKISDKELQIWRHNVSNGTLTRTDFVNFSDGLGAVHLGAEVAWHPSGNYLAATSRDSSNEVRVYSFNDVTGALSSPISINISPNRDMDTTLDFSPDGLYLVIGLKDVSGSPNLFVYSFNGSSLVLNASIEVGYDVKSVSWSPVLSNYIAVGLEANSESFRIYEHKPGEIFANRLTHVTSANVGESTITYAVHWHPTGKYVAYGGKASGDTWFKVYSFNDSTETVMLIHEEIGDDSIEVKGIQWSPVDNFLALGDKEDFVRVFGSLSDTDPLLSLYLDNLVMQLHSTVVATKPWKFINSCTIYGHENKICFDDDSYFESAPGAHLILDNVVIEDLSNGKLKCLHDDSSITLRNSTLILASDYTFSKGSLTCEQDVLMPGPHNFNYTSATQSTIADVSTLYITDGVTFYYDPVVGSKDLIAMEDVTSGLFLSEATLHTTHTGLRLNGGTLHLDNKVTFSSEARSIGEAIELGSDLNIQVLGNAVLDIFGIVKND